MSTGDDTLYLRSRMAVRRGKPDYGGPGGQWSSPPQFMKDGYVKWAESTRPAREGGVEKMPAEKQMPRRGKGIIEDGIALLPAGPLKDMGEFYLQAKEYTPKIKAVLRDKNVQQAIAKGKYAPEMEKIAKYMEMVGLGHMSGDEDMVRRVGGSKSFKQWCKEEMGEESHHGRSHSPEGGRIGMGHKHESMEEHVERCLRGGMSLEETLEALKKKGKAVYDWLKANKSLTKAVLTSKYLNEDLGTDIPRKVKGYMEKVGLGRYEEEVEQELNQLSEAEKRELFGNGISLASVKKGLTKAHEFGKAHGSTLKSLAREYGGEHGKELADLAGKFGYGVFKGDVPRKKSAAATASLIGELTKKGKGGRKPSAYAEFVREFAKKHPGPDLMRRAAAAWRSR